MQLPLLLLYPATDTEFYVTEPTSGTFVYESVQYPNNYLIVDSQGSFSLGSMDGNIHQFKHKILGAFYIGLYADVPGQAYRCYLAFDTNGNQVSNPCSSTLDLELAKLARIPAF